MALRELLLGRPISDDDAEETKIGAMQGVPVLGLDALASASYGPEAALTVLLAAGTSAQGFFGPIVTAITVILVVVYLSYRQTIAAYPDGGGSYTVARTNLGERAGVLAAAALSLDYILNVAVAIAAGVGAIVSTEPRLLPHTLPLCLALLVLLTLANLRGVRTTGVLFTLPTYGFVACLGGAILWGAWKTVLAAGHPQPVVAPAALPAASTATAGLALALRAFANGCTAMTGVEAVSNAVPLFREPRVPAARRTLGIIVAVLVFMLVGIALLAHAYQIGATEPGQEGYQSVLSQLVAAVAGHGPFYYATMATIFAVLCLSANTSFADFPRVCRMLAVDGYLPQAFGHAGRRLVYTTGILVLSVLSAALLVAFGGVTDKLIPLFAVGALGAFTMSQAGMVAHWRREQHRAKRALVLNAAGGLATGLTLVTVVVSKFTEGAWMTVVFIPLVFLLFDRTHAHYERVAHATVDMEPMRLGELPPPVVVVPVKALDRVTRKAIRFALTISPHVHALYVMRSDEQEADLSRSWPQLVERPAHDAGLPAPRLVTVRSAYRQVCDPLLGYVRSLGREDPDRFVAVLVPELVEHRWYHYLLHSHTATVLKMMLLFRGGPQVVIINAPWHVRERSVGVRRGRAVAIGVRARTAQRPVTSRR